MTDCNNCFVCDKVYPQKKSLYAHLRITHRIEPNMDGTVKCPKDGCSYSCHVLSCLRNHVQKQHMVMIHKRKIMFQSFDDFLKWKLEEEKKTRSSFVQRGGPRRLKGGTKLVYMCHRTGVFTSRSDGKRVLKSQGSNKMGSHCTAAMELNRDASGNCTLLYFETHFGHELDVGFLRLSTSERKVIAGKMAEGMSFQRILDDVRGSTKSEEVERLQLLTRKDLHNISRDFGIDYQRTQLKTKLQVLANHVDSLDMEEVILLEKDVDHWISLCNSGFNREDLHCVKREELENATNT